jgi:hypothetical protein
VRHFGRLAGIHQSETRTAVVVSDAAGHPRACGLTRGAFTSRPLNLASSSDADGMSESGRLKSFTLIRSVAATFIGLI